MPSEQRMRREVSELCLVFVLYMAVIELIDRFSIFVSGEVDFNNLFGLSGTAFNRMEMVRYLGTYILMFAVPLSVYFIVKSKEKTTDYFLVNRAPKMGATMLGCVGILAINYVFTIIPDAGVMIFSRIGVLADVPELMAIGKDPVCNILYFIILVVAPAILEEFCFRGVICGRLARYNKTAAVLISSILFSLIHMNFDQIPFAFAAGLLLGYLYVRTGSIWGGVILHAVNNGFAYFSEYLFYEYDNAMSVRQIYMVGWAAVFLVGLVCLVILGLSHKDAEQEPPLTWGQAVVTAAGNPVFIICCALSLAAAVLAVPLL